MRIREIEAENFKLFTENFHEVNKIEESDLVVFNGPNGYGKTNKIAKTDARNCSRSDIDIKRVTENISK